MSDLQLYVEEVREVRRLVIDMHHSNNEVARKVDVHGARIDGMSLEIGSALKRHSDNFRAIDRDMGAIEKRGERRDSEIVSRLRDLDDAVKDTLTSLAERFDDRDKSLTEDVNQLKLEFARKEAVGNVLGKGALILCTGVGTVVGGVITALVTAWILGGHNEHVSNAPTDSARPTSAVVGSAGVRVARDP